MGLTKDNDIYTWDGLHVQLFDNSTRLEIENFNWEMTAQKAASKDCRILPHFLPRQCGSQVAMLLSLHAMKTTTSTATLLHALNVLMDRSTPVLMTEIGRVLLILR